MTPRYFFEEELPRQLSDEVAARAACSFQFIITGAEAPEWGVDFKRPAPWVVEGRLDAPDCTITVNAEDFAKLATKKLKPEMAVMLGKIKMEGDLQYAFKLKELMG